MPDGKLDSARLLSDKNMQFVNKAQNALGLVAKAMDQLVNLEE